MSKRLLIIAGCNGAGKSSYSQSLTDNDLIPFDYDLHFLDFYGKLQQSEFQETMAHNLPRSEFERQINKALSNGESFCYETNFNSTPMYWPQKFKEAGYSLEMMFFCLDSVETAKERVAIRVQNKGHFVPNHEIEERFKLGYNHLQLFFNQFSVVHIIDSSPHKNEPVYCFRTNEGKLEMLNVIPEFLRERIPGIIEMIEKE